MTTLFEIGQECWLFNGDKLDFEKQTIQSIAIAKDSAGVVDVFYQIEGGLIRERLLFSSEEEARSYYRTLFGK